MSEDKYPEISSPNLKEDLQKRIERAQSSATGGMVSDYLIHRRIVLKPHHFPTGKTKHYEGSSRDFQYGEIIPPPHELVIAQIPPDLGYYLLHLDPVGKELTDTYHESLSGALAQAEWEFNVLASEWENTTP